jgi:hypothetical protein
MARQPVLSRHAFTARLTILATDREAARQKLRQLCFAHGDGHGLQLLLDHGLSIEEVPPIKTARKP